MHLEPQIQKALTTFKDYITRKERIDP